MKLKDIQIGKEYKFKGYSSTNKLNIGETVTVLKKDENSALSIFVKHDCGTVWIYEDTIEELEQQTFSREEVIQLIKDAFDRGDENGRAEYSESFCAPITINEYLSTILK